MSLARFLIQPVVIVQPGTTTNRYGATIPDWTDPTETATRGWLTQLNGSEVLGNRDAQVSDWKLYLAATDTISAGDRVVANGITYEVDGPVLQANTPRGLHHQEAALHAVSG